MLARKLVKTRPLVVTRRQLSTETRATYLDLDRKYVMHPYTSMTDPLPTFAIKRAQGVHMYLDDGRETPLLDGMSSWWAAVHGYRHPKLDQALKQQVDEMAHVMFGGLTHRPASELCKLLVDITPESLQKVFLCDSGSVSVEVAMKMAVQYYYTIGKSRKTKFLTISNGYHGDTFGAMSVCDPVNGMHSMFQGILARNLFAGTPQDASIQASLECAKDLGDKLEKHGEDICAIIVEPIVQGAGGMRFYSPAFLHKLRELCDAHDVLLIFDEIATGFGRTGTLFGCQQTVDTFRPLYASKANGLLEINGKQEPVFSQDLQVKEVQPDIMCLGKALTGGYMTMGATLANQKVCEGISGSGGVFMHGPTFMGNPLSSAVALASLRLLLEDASYDEKVKQTEAAFKKAMPKLVQLPSVANVRVLGAIGVCELVQPVQDMAKTQRAFVEEGVWLRPFGKLFYSMPPFNSPDFEPEKHVNQIVDAIYNVAAKL